jgi:DNA-binding NtrC family response regulator
VIGVREQLERLVEDMMQKGIRYREAHREFEHRFITCALTRSDGNLCQAAKLLGIHRNTLSRKIAEHRIRRRF